MFKSPPRSSLPILPSLTSSSADSLHMCHQKSTHYSRFLIRLESLFSFETKLKTPRHTRSLICGSWMGS